MSARDNILRRVRAALDDVRQDSGRVAAADEKLSRHPRAVQPAMEWDPVARFKSCCIGLSSTVDEVATLEQVPQAVAAYLREHRLPEVGVCWPDLAGLPWQAAGLAMHARAANGDDKVGVTGCFCAIAETGTLMMHSGVQTPLTGSLLPDVHVALVRRSRLVSAMEDAWDLLRRELGELPRQVAFVSGPSRTADIEMTMVLGIHGPYRVHIILVNDL